MSSLLDIPKSHPFSIHNLPSGRGRIKGRSHIEPLSRIGEYAILLNGLVKLGYLNQATVDNAHLLPESRAIRATLTDLLRRPQDFPEAALCHLSEVEMAMPFEPTVFVDFYSGIHHASNVGRLFRPDMPALLPNYRNLPVAYNSRPNTVVVSGQPVPRPAGQQKLPDQERPVFGPTCELDFELEVAFVTGASFCGSGLSPADARQLIRGFVLLNDWSARDVQRWEYQPLGPFLAKSFCTSISAWVIHIDALAPFVSPGMPQIPPPLDYLQEPESGHYKIDLSIALQPSGAPNPTVISRTSSLELYWSPGQQLAHIASNGTRIEPNELYASGTISSPMAEDGSGNFGSLLELTARGSKPISVGHCQRTFLEDGDTVILEGHCGEGEHVIGFGECRGTVAAWEGAHPKGQPR